MPPALPCAVRYVAMSVKVNVTLDDQHVVNSPFSVPVSNNPDTQEASKKSSGRVEPLLPYN